MQLRVSHVVIQVGNLARMLHFYEEVLGFGVADRGKLSRPGGPEIAFLSQVSSEHHQLAFVEGRREGEAPGPLDHVAFRVASITEVREVLGRLRRDGRATDVATITHGNAWSVYFRDPEHNRVEVFCDTPWHVRQPVVEPWDASMTDEALCAHTERTFSDQPSFGPMAEWTAARARELGEDG